MSRPSDWVSFTLAPLESLKSKAVANHHHENTNTIFAETDSRGKADRDHRGNDYLSPAHDKEPEIYQHFSLEAIEQAYQEAVQRVSNE
jgi:hypothetical protein